jgi:hypothetical protein
LKLFHVGKHCIYHLKGDYVLVGHFWKLYIEQALGGVLILMVSIGGVEGEAAVLLEMETWLRKRGEK